MALLLFAAGVAEGALVLAAVNLIYAGLARYRVERGWALAIEQYDALHDSSPAAL